MAEEGTVVNRRTPRGQTGGGRSAWPPCQVSIADRGRAGAMRFPSAPFTVLTVWIVKRSR